MKIETRISQLVLLVAAASLAQHSEAAPAPVESSNCTAPAPVNNVFDIPGLRGWQLLSQEDFLSNSASGYSANINCSWLIRRPNEDSIVLIKIVRMRLESGSTCQFDSLQLQYLNDTANAKVNTSYCGTIMNKVLFANSDVNISFKTDDTVTYRGFQLQWAFVNQSLAMRIKNDTSVSQDPRCTQLEDLQHLTLENITAPAEQLLSHDGFGDSDYGNDLNCEWTVTSPTGYILLLTQELELETIIGTETPCSLDYLQITFFNYQTGQFENKTFCGKEDNIIFLSNTSVAVKFRTDSSIGSRGFRIKFMYLTEDQIGTALQVLSALGRPTSSGTTAAPLESSNCTAPTPVNNLFYTPGLRGWQLLSHAGYMSDSTSKYSHNRKCSWLIRRPDNDRIVLIKIVRMELETVSLLTIETRCQFDWLQLQYLNYSSNANVNKSFCGTAVNKVLLANSDVTISFKTDESVNYRGFQLQWAFVNQSLAMRIKNPSSPTGRSQTCGKPEDLQQVTQANITAPGGRLLSHENFGDSSYGSNMNCQWTLTSPTGYILFWIEDLTLEYSGSGEDIKCNYDYLRMTFLDIVSGEVQNVTLCHSSQAAMFLSNTSVAMKFVTDSSVQMSGFQIKWMYLSESQASSAIQLWSSLENKDTRCTLLEDLQQVTVGNITAPGGQLLSHDGFGDSTYENNLNCQWTVTSPTGYTLLLFDVMQLEGYSSEVRDCRFDYLKLKFFNFLTGDLEESKFCGANGTMFLSNTSIAMKFITDSSVQERGFRIKWMHVTESQVGTALQLLRTIERSTAAPTTSAPIKSINCTAPAPVNNLFNIIGLRGWQLLSQEDYLSNSASRYPKNMNCSWFIRRSDTQNVLLIKIVRLQLEYSSDCPFDSLRLHYFNYSSNTSVNTSYCDLEMVNKVLVIKSNVTISFKTDGSVNYRGFQLQWAFVKESVALEVKNPRDKFQCAVIETMDDGRRRIAGRLFSKTEKQCQWTVLPQRENSVIRFRVQKFRVAASYRIVSSEPIEDCKQMLTLKTNSSIDAASAKKIATSIVSKLTKAGDLSSFSTETTQRICSQQYSENGTAGDSFSMFSAGPIEINTRIMPYSRKIDYDFVIEEINVAALSAGRKTKN